MLYCGCLGALWVGSFAKAHPLAVAPPRAPRVVPILSSFGVHTLRSRRGPTLRVELVASCFEKTANVFPGVKIMARRLVSLS